MKKNIKRGAFIIFAPKLSLQMKLTTLLLLLSMLKITASSYSQNIKISLNLEEVSVEQVIKTIEEKSEFHFFYNEEDFDIHKKVTLIVNN